MGAPFRLIGVGTSGRLRATDERRAPEVGRARPLAVGVHGQITWHYYTAAEVRGYLVEQDLDGSVLLRAQVANADEYKLTQVPLMFVIRHQRGAVRWPITRVITYRDHAFTARLGAVEGAPAREAAPHV